MKVLPPGLSDHLSSGATTLCWCWRLTRRDGFRLGFTDHDRDIEFDGTLFEAAAGFGASEINDALGLSVDNLEVESALSSGRLSEHDLAAGLYDDAAVEIFRVNWQVPEQRVLMRSGSIGEVRRTGTAFSAEVRGLAHYLQQPVGRLYQFGCDAHLGDERCRVDVSSESYRATGTVLDVRSAKTFSADGIDEFASGWFTSGLISFTSGGSAGLAFEVKRHAAIDSGTTLELWQQPPHAIAAGDAFVVTAGCDKQFATCRSKFSNGENFRGFPHMPGNDFLTAVARSGSR
ncbi:MAG: DUF2163 domain-containing protein [Hyphomicrobiaceae bacterium]